MLATLVSAALTCAGAVLVGQLALRLCGAQSWSWSAPVSAWRCSCLRRPGAPPAGPGGHDRARSVGAPDRRHRTRRARTRHRPPLKGMLAGVPVALLALVPFLTAWRSGTLGVGSTTTWRATSPGPRATESALIAKVNQLADDYPLGPTRSRARSPKGSATASTYTFAGHHARPPRPDRLDRAWGAEATGLVRAPALALVVGLPFFVAGYYGQGSFKESSEALFALAVVLFLSRTRSCRRCGAGSLSGFCSPARCLSTRRRARLAARRDRRLAPRPLLLTWGARDAPAAGRRRPETSSRSLAGLGVVSLLLVPQLPRLLRFFQANGRDQRHGDRGVEPRQSRRAGSPCGRRSASGTSRTTASPRSTRSSPACGRRS